MPERDKYSTEEVGVTVSIDVNINSCDSDVISANDDNSLLALCDVNRSSGVGVSLNRLVSKSVFCNVLPKTLSSKDEKSGFFEFGNELTDNESTTEANAVEVTARELKGGGDITPEADAINLSIVEYSMAVLVW